MGFQSEGYIINKIPKLINNSNSNYTLLEKITFNLISISGILNRGVFSGVAEVAAALENNGPCNPNDFVCFDSFATPIFWTLVRPCLKDI